MEHMAWKGRIKPGCKAEYQRRHAEIWPEMIKVLKEAGICNYSIFYCKDELFGYYECEKGVAYAEKVQAESPIVDRWNEYMSVVGIFIGLITAIGEEIGWRGYLVPATLERVGIKKALIYTSIFWGVWHLPILISGLYMPGTPAWYSVPAFLFMIIPVGMIYGIITIKTKSIWPAIFLHAAHNTFDQLIFGTVTVANNKMFFVSETGIFTIIFAWIVAVFLYKKCND